MYDIIYVVLQLNETVIMNEGNSCLLPILVM